MSVRSGTNQALHLAALFSRAWQVRFTAIMVFAACLSIAASAMVVDSFTLSSGQRADSLMGNADAVVQFPGGVLLGSDYSVLDADITAAVSESGGLDPSIEYVAQVRPDADLAHWYLLTEISNPARESSRLSLEAGMWPSKIGETAISAALSDRWPVGSTLTAFNGRLSLEVVGTFEDVFRRGYDGLIVPTGSWASMSGIPEEVAATLQQTGAREVRWSGSAPPETVYAAVASVVAQSDATGQDGDPTGEAMTTRAEIESRAAGGSAALSIANVAAPAVAGLLGGLVSGLFLRRSRSTLWTLGVAYQQSSAAAYLVTLIAASIGAWAGVLGGALAGVALRPLLDAISPQVLGPLSSFYVMPLAAVSATVAVLAGVTIARPRQSRQAVAQRAREAVWDRHLYRIVGATLLFSAGVFIGSGTDSTDQLVAAAVIISLAMLIAAIPIVVSGLARLSPAAFSVRLAARRFASDRGTNVLVILAVATIQVVGFAYPLFVNTAVERINQQTESLVPPGQITLEPELGSDTQVDQVRTQFEAALGLDEPVVERVVDLATEYFDGAILALESADDVEAVIGVPLTSSERAVLEAGGVLRTKPLADASASTLTFPPVEGFDGATLPAQAMVGLDPSFTTIGGFTLTDTAIEEGLPLADSKVFVYTSASDDQIGAARQTAIKSDLNPSWVQVYRAPDVIEPPLRVLSIMLLLALVAGLVILFASSSQVRSLRPVFSGLRAIGVGGRFVTSVAVSSVAMTLALATLLAVPSAILSVWILFSINFSGVTPIVPWVPMAVLFCALTLFSAISALVVARRLRNGEWLDTH